MGPPVLTAAACPEFFDSLKFPSHLVSGRSPNASTWWTVQIVETRVQRGTDVLPGLHPQPRLAFPTWVAIIPGWRGMPYEFWNRVRKGCKTDPMHGLCYVLSVVGTR